MNKWITADAQRRLREKAPELLKYDNFNDAIRLLETINLKIQYGRPSIPRFSTGRNPIWEIDNPKLSVEILEKIYGISFLEFLKTRDPLEVLIRENLNGVFKKRGIVNLIGVNHSSIMNWDSRGWYPLGTGNKIREALKKDITTFCFTGDYNKKKLSEIKWISWASFTKTIENGDRIYNALFINETALRVGDEKILRKALKKLFELVTK